MFEEDDFLLLSGLQHFAFCRRQWALIHVEDQWEENYKTMDAAQYRNLQAKLCAIIDEEVDSLRFYALGNNYESKIQHFGNKTTYDPEGTLIV